jgi:hypothetical protein
MKILRADYKRINSTDADKDTDEKGWIALRGDVFRPPRFPMLFSVLVGYGVQVLGMCTLLSSMNYYKCNRDIDDVYVSIRLTWIFIASKSWRFADYHDKIIYTDGVSKFAWFLVIISQYRFVGGYFSTRTYKILHGTQWKTIATMVISI